MGQPLKKCTRFSKRHSLEVSFGSMVGSWMLESLLGYLKWDDLQEMHGYLPKHGTLWNVNGSWNLFWLYTFRCVFQIKPFKPFLLLGEVPLLVFGADFAQKGKVGKRKTGGFFTFARRGVSVEPILGPSHLSPCA